MYKRHFFQWCLCLFVICGSLYAAPSFPPLTGRVVDRAHLLSPETTNQLETLLANYESATTNQIVVVTIPSLQNYPIEEYGYQLGRFWKIGQKDKNNGVILIIAPTEHKVRIEVGYGLEPILTDALSSTVQQDIILPNIRAGNFNKAVIDGTQAIIEVLGGKAITPANTDVNQPLPGWLMIIIFILFLWFVIRHPLIAAVILSSNSSGSGGGGGFGGGFSGGGGSFGGGGASGSW